MFRNVVGCYLPPDGADSFLRALGDPLEVIDRLARLAEIMRLAWWHPRAEERGPVEAPLRGCQRLAVFVLLHGRELERSGPYDPDDERPLRPVLEDGILLARMRPQEREVYRLPVAAVAARLARFLEDAASTPPPAESPEAG